MGKLIEGRWDCPSCGARGIKASSKNCPNCGNPQDENTKFYMPDKIDYVSDEELIGAKESISGRLKYFTQNNAQIAAVNGYNYIMGLGLDYNDKFLDEIKKITRKSSILILKEK